MNKKTLKKNLNKIWTNLILKKNWLNFDFEPKIKILAVNYNYGRALGTHFRLAPFILSPLQMAYFLM